LQTLSNYDNARDSPLLESSDRFITRDYFASYSIPTNNSATLTTLEDTPRWKEKDNRSGVYSTRALSAVSRHRAFHPIPKDSLLLN